MLFVAVVNFQRGSIKIDTTHSPRSFIGNFVNMQMIDIYVIHRPGGPYWEKLCPRSRVRGRGPYSRQRTQFFPIQTDQCR